MSAKIKKAGAKTAKALGVIFFLFLVVFNVQVATSNEHSSDINLLGLSLSIFTPSAVASDVTEEDPCDIALEACLAFAEEELARLAVFCTPLIVVPSAYAECMAGAALIAAGITAGCYIAYSSC